MIKFEIYTKSYCPFCQHAKALLDVKGDNYQEHEISTDQALQQQMRDRSGRRTVPQIFINNRHIGGSDDLVKAEKSGLLDDMLGLHYRETACNSNFYCNPEFSFHSSGVGS